MMRSFPSGKCLLLCALVVLLASCESPRSDTEAASAPPPAEPPPPPLGVFSAARAFADDVALAQASAEAGSNGALRAYVAAQLVPTGLQVEALDTPGIHSAAAGVAQASVWKNLVATAPGASPDLFVLVARLGERDGAAGSSEEQRRENASGAALLLELARVLSTRSLPYTTRFIWVDGDEPGGTSDASRPAEYLGSLALARQMMTSGDLSRIRLLVAFDRVCRDDLRIARDLRSNRVFREDFFNTGARTGHVEVFPTGEEYESVEASHLAFVAAGLRSAVAIASVTGTPQGGQACAAQSLEAVGNVALAALDLIGKRLAKIDRFARSPLASSRGPAPAPAPQPAESSAPPAPDAMGPAPAPAVNR